ncbi:GntR family transcriptional regulator [Pseudomonas sp. 5P_3.1_Bac2]|uniref:GntR family transcriptional regulator n=1 Tax=Pseudomonas sp. 5P_3.1_Bac2 TaxID=2971617 RepID=UPI0021C8CA63|nr:GntR family transcriptional regulator [Pseudomonas sp. 5P_3.1_Bac2]MCU1717005.1 GntR family transcriptional regulator [Pseudomonas sp. 5P_3.1_Bac2]
MFKAPDSLAEQIAHHLAERIISGEMKARERVQEQKVTQALNVSRGSVREALLILERRHLVVIPPRRGAHVAELTPHNVKSLYSLMAELYIMLLNAVADNWQNEAELAPFKTINERLLVSQQQEELSNFVDATFSIVRSTYSFANNPYLQSTVEDLMPAIRRTYHLSLSKAGSEMGKFLQTYAGLIQGIVERNHQQIREVLLEYAEHNCQLVLAALAEA